VENKIETGSIPERRADLDWLRVLVVLMLIPFHTAMTFAPYPWYLRNDTLNLATMGLIVVLDQYHMELLFLIAGAATFFSLGIRSGGSYFLERVKRLVVPLIFGMLVLVPPCYYIVALHFYHYDGSFFQWYPTFLLNKTLPFRSAFDAGALWFLWYLVFYTFPLIPLFLLIRRKWEQSLIPPLAAFFEKRGALFLLVIPVALVEIYSTRVITGDFKIFYYVLFFAYGFFLFSDQRFLRGIDKSGPIALVGAAITMALYMLLIFPEWNTAILGPTFWYKFKGEPGTWGFIMFRILISFTTLFWIIGILYLARKFLNFKNRFLQYGSEAVLPYYIIHSTPIAVIGYYVVQWNMDVLPKYVINTVLAFVATVALYEIIKRINVTRFLFGMRLKKKPASEER
jgi:glucan biosynthesis protein C